MKKLLLCVCALLVAQLGLAQTGIGAGAKSVALGGASTVLSDVWSVSSNPGALGKLEGYGVGVAYQNQFFLPQMSAKGVSVGIPIGTGTIGVSTHSYGYKSFSQNRVGLAYAQQFSEYFSLGVQFNYFDVNIGDVYGRSGNLVADVGLLVTPSENIRLGVHLFNPTRARLAAFDDERFPSALRVGGMYVFSDKVSLLGEVEKSIDLPAAIKGGVEYKPLSAFAVRLGFNSLHADLSLGVGVLHKGITIDIASTWNPTLGSGGCVSLGYQFGQRKRDETAP